MIQSNQYGFLTLYGNDIFHSIQGVCLTPTTTPNHSNIKGNGTYMYLDNFRRSISLFSTRSLIKSTWLNSNDVYIGRGGVENDTK